MTTSLEPIGLGLMCKPPRPGATKTRLAATIGPVAAARLSRAFLADCASAALDAADISALEPMAFYRPANGADEIGEVLGSRWPLVFADADDLGRTMLDVISHLLVRCPAGAIIMGADVPLITGFDIAEAANHLRAGDDRVVVTIPSIDGGYCLLGVRSLAAAKPLFEPMVWSTSGVLRETLARAEAHDLKPIVLQPQRDIDDIDDLAWLRETLRTGSHNCQATKATLSDFTAMASDE